MKTVRLLFFGLFAFICMSCSFESDGVFTDETGGTTYELYDRYVDAYGNEGIVAHIHTSSSGQRARKYIIVLSSDESCQPWGPLNELVYKSDSLSTLDLSTSDFGVAVYQSMKSKGIDRYPAQAWCDIKNRSDEYIKAGSWRLPSFYEFRLISGNNGSKVDALNNALTTIGADQLESDNMYWTCVEDFDDYVDIKGVENDYDKYNRAIVFTPSGKVYSDKHRWLKKNKYYVRAIKYIYYHY